MPVGQTLGPRTVRRIAVALVAAVLISSMACGAMLTFLKLLQPGQPAGQWWVGLLLYSAVAATFALPSALLIGVPAYVMLDRTKRATRLNLMAVGGAVAALPFFALSWRSHAADPVGALPLAAFLLAVGFFGGWLFWRLAIGGRDRQHGR